MYPDIPIFVFVILPPRAEYEKSVKGISKRIHEYNNILKDAFGENYIDTSDMPDEGIMSDHHHMTSVGHQFVYDKIMERIAKLPQSAN